MKIIVNLIQKNFLIQKETVFTKFYEICLILGAN
jgi:hypothetical protein